VQFLAFNGVRTCANYIIESAFVLGCRLGSPPALKSGASSWGRTRYGAPCLTFRLNTRSTVYTRARAAWGRQEGSLDLLAVARGLVAAGHGGKLTGSGIFTYGMSCATPARETEMRHAYDMDIVVFCIH
jgi:hypothetical protein